MTTCPAKSQLVTKDGPKIRGRFCERRAAPKGAFDARSLRWKRSGDSWVLVGCPRGRYSARAGRCAVGTRAHRVLVPVGRRGKLAAPPPAPQLHGFVGGAVVVPVLIYGVLGILAWRFVAALQQRAAAGAAGRASQAADAAVEGG